MSLLQKTFTLHISKKHFASVGAALQGLACWELGAVREAYLGQLAVHSLQGSLCMVAAHQAYAGGRGSTEG